MGRAEGLSERDLADLDRFETSDAYDDTDRLVLRLATEMGRAQVDVSHELRSALVTRLGRAAYAELAASIAWEHHRARLNRALDVRAAGFSEGAACALPAHRIDPLN